MTEQQRDDANPPQETPPVTPAWVKALGFAAALLLLLVVLLAVTGGVGGHGPGRHGG